jgi:hypothetical protein
MHPEGCGSSWLWPRTNRHCPSGGIQPAARSVQSKLRAVCPACCASFRRHEAHFRPQPHPASTQSQLLVEPSFRSATRRGKKQASSSLGRTRPAPTSTRPADAGDRTRSKATIRARCRAQGGLLSSGGKPPQEVRLALRSRRAEARRVRRPDGAWTAWRLSARPTRAWSTRQGRQASSTLRSRPVRPAKHKAWHAGRRTLLNRAGALVTEQPADPVAAKASLRGRRQGPSEPGHHKGGLTRKSSAGGKAAAAVVPAEASLRCVRRLRTLQPQGPQGSKRLCRLAWCASTVSWPRKQALTAGDTSCQASRSRGSLGSEAPCRRLGAKGPQRSQQRQASTAVDTG